MTRARRGFTLVEVIVVTAALGMVAMVFGTVMTGLHRTERHSGAYVADLEGLRRAVRTIERDLRAGRAPEYAVEDGTLTRDGAVLATNIAVLDFAREGDVTAVVIGLAPRSDVPSARRPVVRFKVGRRP